MPATTSSPRARRWRERARAIGNAEIAALAEHGELMGAPMRYRFPHSQRRHYERLRRLPARLPGDGRRAGQLQPGLRPGHDGGGLRGAGAARARWRRAWTRLPRRFFKAAARVIDTPWQLAVGGDLALPQVAGPRPFPVRHINAYVARVQAAAVFDPIVANAFVQVMHLLAPPASLFAPAVLWRVWRSGRQRASAATAATA